MNPDEQQSRIDELFDETVAMPSHERADFLDRACAHVPPEIRQEVEKLLTAYDREREVAALRPGPPLPGMEGLREVQATDPMMGRQIGKYVIKKRIGRGGFGNVYRLFNGQLAIVESRRLATDHNRKAAHHDYYGVKKFAHSYSSFDVPVKTEQVKPVKKVRIF